MTQHTYHEESGQSITGEQVLESATYYQVAVAGKVIALDKKVWRRQDPNPFSDYLRRGDDIFGGLFGRR